MKIHVHIDRLTVEGLQVNPAGGPAIKTAVETEITRLLLEQGVAGGMSVSGARAEVRGGAIGPGAGAKAEDLGRQIGRAIHEGLNR